MTSQRWQHVKTLLNEALDCPPGERARFLDDACADDAALREEVQSLLDAYDDSEAFFSEGAFAEEDLSAGAPFEEGVLLGPYRLTEVLGRGGMGTVYRARRADGQHEREVALKVIRPGLHSDEVVQRFRAERQILASLEHPHIARLYDGGLTDDGRPYFAMECVEGTPLNRYCDAERLSVDARLRLFETVAEAVAHAHSKLVVHRDLKPSNILITAEGEPTLLDFGIAKLLVTDAASPATAPVTRTGQHLMTPEYAAPEQVRGEAATPATDVYALGALLYELLTGRRPYHFEKRTPSHVERVICETQPERPSTAVTRAAADETATPEHASRARSTQPSRLKRALKGDLDRIIMKALRKEPERRYASAAELAGDLRRHRKGLPVEARPATWRYRTGKLVRRHRWGMAAAVVLALLLVGYAATVSVQARRLAAERDRAQAEAAKTEQVSSFLISLFEAGRPGESPDGTVTARELLARGAERAKTLEGQPAVQARMLEEIGIAYRELGRHEQAIPLVRRALALRRRVFGDKSIETARSLNHLGLLLWHQGDDAADSMYREALAIRRKTLGPKHPKTATMLNNLGILLRYKGDYAAADSMYREALSIKRETLGPEHPKTATTLNNLGIVLRHKGDYAAADSMYREALAIRRKTLGPKHPRTARTLNNLGILSEEKGDYAAADTLFRQALTIRRQALGERHPDVAKSQEERAELLQKQGHYGAAERFFRKALAIRRATLPADHHETEETVQALVELHNAWGKPEQAAAWRDSLRTTSSHQLTTDHRRASDENQKVDD